MKATTSMVTILTSRVFWPVVRIGAIAAALALSGCGTSHLYPELRDMPTQPTGTTSEAERERIIKKLEQERDNPAQEHTPAVPPLPTAAAGQSSSLAALWACDAGATNPAVPPLRGTLHGDWHPPPETNTASSSPGTGITGALPAVGTDQRGALVLSFLSGGATLTSAQIARLHEATNDFLLQGGTTISVKARGGAEAAGAVPHRPLASLSLGLKRASAIVNALVAAGIRPDHIRISAQGDEDVPAMAAEDWSKAGPDGAIVIFEPVNP